MRHVIKPHRELGGIDIAGIDLARKCRDDMPALLTGLQHLYCDEELRSGMELWPILVMGVVMQGLNCDFDRLHDLVNEHNTLRQFLGHADIWDRRPYSYQSVVDNVSLVTPELLAEVGKLVVGSGHKVSTKSLASCCTGVVIRLWLRRMFITRRMSPFCGMRCAF